jgi:1-deoxy-D-xylulose-5-phosphate synthase
MRFVKPLDETLLHKLVENHKHFFCIEDNSTQGGAGSAVSEWLHRNNLDISCHLNGLDDEFPMQGSRPQVLSEYQLDHEQLARKIEAILTK